MYERKKIITLKGTCGNKDKDCFGYYKEGNCFRCKQFKISQNLEKKIYKLLEEFSKHGGCFEDYIHDIFLIIDEETKDEGT